MPSCSSRAQLAQSISSSLNALRMMALLFPRAVLTALCTLPLFELFTYEQSFICCPAVYAAYMRCQCKTKKPSDFLRQRARLGCCVAGCSGLYGVYSGCGLVGLDCVGTYKRKQADGNSAPSARFISFLIVSLPYFACMIASIALMAALRRPFSSREATPLMVVPPGEHTASLSTAGCLPVSTAILPVPAIICPASW